MYVGILAGGKGTRLSEETDTKPKPMVTIGGYPILEHIMQMYEHHGFYEFSLALGYLGNAVRDYFMVDWLHQHYVHIEYNSGTIDFAPNEDTMREIHFLETGIDTNTAGRVRQLLEHAGGTIMVTYGDGLSDVNLRELLHYHNRMGRLATVTAVHPPTRFGEIRLSDDGYVTEFNEKPTVDSGWINGGFFVLDWKVTKYIHSDDESFERDVLPRLVTDMELVAFPHIGFWQCVDNIRELTILREMWDSGMAPWVQDEIDE